MNYLKIQKNALNLFHFHFYAKAKPAKGVVKKLVSRFTINWNYKVRNISNSISIIGFADH